jgi:tetratricopeptide (TPR) repeat protein
MTRSFRLLVGALALSSAMPLSAGAAPKKKGKTPPSVVDTTPAAPVKKPGSPVKKDDERKGPASFNANNGRPGQQSPEDIQRELAVDKKNDESIAELKNVIRQVPSDSTQKADLIFQLAELYYAKSKYIYSKEMRSYFAAGDDVANRRDKGEKIDDAKLDIKLSEQWRSEALRLYQQILKEYPTYERKDEVLFTLAYNQYEDLKTRPKAVENYFTLIKQYPNSRYVPDAYVQLGEHFFNANDLEKARKSYTEALKSNSPKIHNFALYKLAWCDFNSGDYDGSIKKFKQVIEASAKGDESGKKDRIQLKNEALNDVVTPFVQVEATDEAISYFEAQTTKKKAHTLTKKLADNMEGAGKHEAAIKVYRTLIAKDPNDTDAPVYQQSIVSAYEQLRRRDLVAKEMHVLVDTYGPKSQWAQINKDNKSAMSAAYEATEGAMRKMVTEYHQEAQRTKDVATYKLARDIYKQYVDNFGDSEYSYNLRFYYAEILYTLQEWESAAEQYEGVVAANPGEYGSKSYRKAAAYDALLCYEKLSAIARGEIKQTTLADNQKVDDKQSKGEIKKVTVHIEKNGTAQQEEQIPKWEQKLAEACDKYIEVAPNDPDEIAVRYKASFIYYTHHHDVEAANRFGAIINKWPTDKFSRQAADFTLNILENKKQWADLNRLSRSFIANKKLTTGDKDFTARLAKIVEGSQYNVDEELFKVQKKPAEAAVAFRDFVKEFPKSAYAPQGLLYAMIIFQDANQLDQGIAVGEQLLKDYPESNLGPQTHLNLAYYYSKTAQYPQSARAYEAYVKLWESAHGISDTAAPKKGDKKKAAKAVAKKGEKKPAAKGDQGAGTAELDKHVADALFNAALYHEGLGEDEVAIAEYNKYVDYTEAKKPGFDKNDAPEVFLGTARIHEKARSHKLAAETYETYLTRFGKQVTADRAYLARYRQMVAMRELHPPTVNGAKYSEDRDVQKLISELISGYPKLDEKARNLDPVIDAFGHARFLTAEPLWREYVAVSFKDPKKVLADLKAKIKMIDQVKNAYTGVVETRSGEWAIASLTRIGLGYEDFARDLLDSPDPKGLNEDQLQMYRAELENKAFPYEDKAVEFLELALNKSTEYRIYGEWSLKAQDQMNKIKPGAFGEVRSIGYRGSEFFATAPAVVAAELPKAESPAPAPAAKPAPASAPAAPKAAGAGGN